MLSSLIIALVLFCLTLLPLILAACISMKFMWLYLITYIVFAIANHYKHSEDEIEGWQVDEYYNEIDHIMDEANKNKKD